ncbi:MAG: glycosyl hydrolase [Campylobacterales bacterium]|nr:glycosyl hydrolase [Campylobacterales bacterium]
MTKKISVILAALAIVALFWYLVGEVFILKSSENSISKLQCVSYAPFSKDQSPMLFDQGMVISEEQVREDLTLLSKYTDCIRTYSILGLEMVPKIARENGLKMLMGGWVSSDKIATEKEIKALITLASQNRDIVKAIIVGNEALLRGEVTDTTLIGYIKEVKKALPDIKVTYADVWEFWLKHPQIREVTDFVTIHILPYWEDDPMNIDASLKHLAEVRGEVEAILKEKNILIGETGWPSEGRMREDALPSKVNQAIYIRGFVKLAEENEWSYNIIEAFDQPWKRMSEGAVGGFWGLFDKDRVDKHVFAGDVSNFPNYKPLAFGSLLLLFAFSFLLRGSKIATKKVVLFGAINSLFAILFMLQAEQYMMTARTALEFGWAGLVLATHFFIYYFLLYNIAKDKKPEIINISAILKQKIFNADTSLMVLFYLSFVFLLISNLALALEGRYKNFDIYIFTVSAISFLWLYRGRFESMHFGRFEKASSLILAITTVAIFVNESYLNLFSDLWVLISVGFASILYMGSKKTALSELKNLALFMILFFGIFAYLRYGIFMNDAVAAQCNVSADSFLCTLRAKIGLFAYMHVFGEVAVAAAVVALFANKRVLSILALFLSIGALMMMNAFFGAIAFAVAVFVMTKNTTHKIAGN